MIHLLMVISLVLPSFISSSILVSAEQNKSARAKSGDQYITDSRWETSQNIDIIDGNTVELNTVYNLHYDFMFPDGEFSQGDKVQFSIPPEFRVVNNTQFVIRDENGEELGLARILGNDVDGYYIDLEFTTDYIEKNSDVSGSLDINFVLNEKYVREDSEITVDLPTGTITVPVAPNENGGGGVGNPGDPTQEIKKGNIIQGSIKDPITGEEVLTNIIEWEIQLGRDVLLGKADSFDQIESIIIEDFPKGQELIPISIFNSNNYDPGDFGLKWGYYSDGNYTYDAVREDSLELIKSEDGSYIQGFKLDILPFILEYVAEAEKNGVEFNQFDFTYYTIPLDDPFEDTEFTNDAKIKIKYKSDGLDPDDFELSGSVDYTVAEGSVSSKFGAVEFEKVDELTGRPLQGAEFELYRVPRDGGEPVLIQSGITSGPDGKVRVDKLKTGDYYFVETKAPAGYEKSDEKIEFSITSNDLSTTQNIIRRL